MSAAESALHTASRPEIPARLPIAVALLWLTAFSASALPWFDQLHFSQLLAAFLTFDGNQYASVLAHFSWAFPAALVFKHKMHLNLLLAWNSHIKWFV